MKRETIGAEPKCFRDSKMGVVYGNSRGNLPNKYHGSTQKPSFFIWPSMQTSCRSVEEVLVVHRRTFQWTTGWLVFLGILILGLL